MAAVRIAGLQFEPKLGRVEENLARILRGVEEAADDGASLVVFPEAALQGYCFAGREAVDAVAEPVPGPSTEAVREVAARRGVTVVFGLFERAARPQAGPRSARPPGDPAPLYNAAAVVTPERVLGAYRKVHLPRLGGDRFVDAGDVGFPVWDTPAGRLGVSICYDGSFPEACRAQKLAGAQILCLPTNWPDAAKQRLHLPETRAHENHAYFVAVNRVGTEEGFTFRGGSKITGLRGEVLAEAPLDVEARIVADVDPPAADRNLIANVAGAYELDRVAHRRPDLYGALTEVRAPRAVLFLCVANSARSKLAEALARRMGPPGLRVAGAGSSPTSLRPEVVSVLAEVGVDPPSPRSRSLADVDLSAFDTVVTLCVEDVCPAPPPGARRLHWPLADPAAPARAPDDPLAPFRAARDELARHLRDAFGWSIPESWTATP